MSKESLNDIIIPNNIDEVIDAGVKKAIKENEAIKKRRKIKVGTTAAGIALVFILGVMKPAIASNVPFIGGVFEKIQNKISFLGDYSNYATSINEAVYDNGVNVKLSEIYADGESLYVTYAINSEKPFKYTKYEYDAEKDKDIAKEEAKEIVGTQLLYDGEGKVDFTDKILDNSGTAGLEGEFIDENTFVGVEKYDLRDLNMKIPNEFQFEITIKNLRCTPWNSNEKDQVLKGKWGFKIPVKVDTSSLVEIDVNEMNKEGYGVKKVILTPFEGKVITTHPKDAGFNDFEVKVYDEKGEQIEFEMGHLYENTMVDIFEMKKYQCKSLKIKIYKNTLKKEGNTIEIIKSDEIFSVNVDLEK